MITAADKFRVLIPTTNGLVDVLLLTEEDPAIGRCVACIGGTTETADIAAAYHAFVVRPTGVIESLFGHPCFRLDVSGRIDAGSSWQLGVLAAHALHAAGRLAGEKDAHGGVLWATGSVRPVDLTVGAVSHIPEKLASSVDGLKQEAALGHRVVLAIPEQNASDLSAGQKADLAAHGIAVIAPAHVQALFDALALTLPKSPPRLASNPVAPRTGVRSTAPRRTPLISAAVAAVLLCIAAASVYLLGWAPAFFAPRSPKVTRADANLLVPESVPFITDRDQVRIRAAYMPAADYKALALGPAYMAFVTGQASQDIANTSALAACEKIGNAQPGVCELWAAGNVVLASHGRPPMPPQPWVIRDPSIERPFVAADIPLLSAEGKRFLESYPSYPKSKALALAPSMASHSQAGAINADEASRRALQRCGYEAGVACMLIAIDDEFVVPIPKLAKVIGFFQPQALTDVATGLRDSVIQRLATAHSGWNAVAIGASGQVGLELSAPSERVAIDRAITACNRQDSNCQIAVIGPFMVERAPSKTPTASRDPGKADDNLLVPELVPFISASDQAKIRAAYMPAPDYKALALSVNHMAFVTGQVNQAIANTSAMSACQKISAAKKEKPNACDLYASGNALVIRSRPPMPPQPWFVRDPLIERPFVAADVPLMSAANKKNLESYPSYGKSKALALAPTAKTFAMIKDVSVEEVGRRTLERCGYEYGVACMIIALDDDFVVPIPKLAKVIGFFSPEALTSVAPAVRDSVIQQLTNAHSGWNAVAIGAGGQVGLQLGAPSEQAAIDGAMNDCSKQDSDCRVAVIGPFMVENAHSQKLSAPSASATRP